MVDAQVGRDQIQKIVNVLEFIDAVHGVTLTAPVIWEHLTIEPDHVIDTLTNCLLLKWLVGGVDWVSLGVIADDSLLLPALGLLRAI